MVPLDLVLWEVDTQADFMLPGGKLYVPGAERLLPNIAKLTEAAHKEHVFLVSHGCFHTPDDPEFQQFPPHCVKGTNGSEFVGDAVTNDVTRVPNESPELPKDVLEHKQVLLEKQTLDIFESKHAEKLLSHFPKHAEFLVFGVVTEYCVRFAAKGLLKRGRKVSVITDAIETLDPEAGRKTLAELKSLGARLTTTKEVLSRIHPRA